MQVCARSAKKLYMLTPVHLGGTQRNKLMQGVDSANSEHDTGRDNGRYREDNLIQKGQTGGSKYH